MFNFSFSSSLTRPLHVAASASSLRTSPTTKRILEAFMSTKVQVRMPELLLPFYTCLRGRNTVEICNLNRHICSKEILMPLMSRAGETTQTQPPCAWDRLQSASSEKENVKHMWYVAQRPFTTQPVAHWRRSKICDASQRESNSRADDSYSTADCKRDNNSQHSVVCQNKITRLDDSRITYHKYTTSKEYEEAMNPNAHRDHKEFTLNDLLVSPCWAEQ